jgi:hypothetical protein
MNHLTHCSYEHKIWHSTATCFGHTGPSSGNCSRIETAALHQFICQCIPCFCILSFTLKCVCFRMNTLSSLSIIFILPCQCSVMYNICLLLMQWCIITLWICYFCMSYAVLLCTYVPLLCVVLISRLCVPSIVLSHSEGQSARNATSWPQPIPYLLPIPPPLCDMVSPFTWSSLPLLLELARKEGFTVDHLSCLAYERRSQEFYQPAKGPTSKFCLVSFPNCV